MYNVHYVQCIYRIRIYNEHEENPCQCGSFDYVQNGVHDKLVTIAFDG